MFKSWHLSLRLLSIYQTAEAWFDKLGNRWIAITVDCSKNQELFPGV